MLKTEFTRRHILAMVPSAAIATMVPLPVAAEVKTVVAAQAAPTATAAKVGRWAVETYVSAWERLCDAAWRQELQDPSFRKAVEFAKTTNPRPTADAHWLVHEAWRNDVRSWWFPVRRYYRKRRDVPADWIDRQRARDRPQHRDGLELWFPGREATLTHEKAFEAYRKRQDAHWWRLRLLVDTEDFWPLHLDADSLLQQQFGALREWATAATSERSRASWGIPQTPPRYIGERTT